jgi:hypothetical protein
MANPSTHLENKPVTTRMNLFPVGVRGYGLIKWQAITSNGLFGCRAFWGATCLGPHACTVRRGDSDACTSGRFLAASVSGNAGRLTSPSPQLWGGRRTPRHVTRTILVGARRETRITSSRVRRKARRPPRSTRCETSAPTALQVWRAPLAHRLPSR